MSTERVPFPEVVDNSILSTARKCYRRAELTYFDDWAPREPSVHLHAGAAFARGLEIVRLSYYRDGLSESSSIEAGLRALLAAYGTFEPPPGSAKTAERMAGALVYYFDQWPLKDADIVPLALPGGPSVEFNFVLPLEIDHPTSGQPILYSGRFDMLASRNGMLYVEDDKTTSSLGVTWAKQWELSSQMTGYVWGGRKFGHEIEGAIIRGVSILKTKYDSAEAITFRPTWMIDRWYRQIHRTLAELIECWRGGYFDFNLDAACTVYGGCPFIDVCTSADPTPWLESQFVKHHYDPTRVED